MTGASGADTGPGGIRHGAVRPAGHRRADRGPLRLRSAVGDYFELVNSSQLRLPPDRHFCIFALQSVLPLLPAKQRQLPDGDWLERDSLVCCPDPEERLVMRIERTGRRRMNSADLT